MKKIFNIIFCILAFAGTALGATYESPMSLYKDNYFTAGNQEDQVKFQISAKYNIFYPAKTGLYAGYTQISWWTCYQRSDTFSSNYQPEVFYRLESNNNPFDLNLGLIDYIQFSPIQHSSTGEEGPELHRSINIYYGQIQMSFGEVFNVGFNAKGYGYYSKSKYNKDINDYRHNYEGEVFFKLKSKSNWYVDKFEVHAKCVGNPADKGYYMLEGVCQIFTSKIQPKLFVQYNNGYGVNMVTYNKKEKELRFGITFQGE